jgi:hypothetical protein
MRIEEEYTRAGKEIDWLGHRSAPQNHQALFVVSPGVFSFRVYFYF